MYYHNDTTKILNLQVKFHIFSNFSGFSQTYIPIFGTIGASIFDLKGDYFENFSNRYGWYLSRHLGAYDKARLDNLLDACEAKDYVFTVASGRALLALEELFDGFVDRIAIIAENGALVQYKGEVLFESKLEPKDYLEIADTTLALPTWEFSCRDVVVPMHQTMQIQPILRPWNATMKML